MKVHKLNESTEHPYMFQYNCNNSTFGYDFQRYAQELGAKRMYDHTQKGGGMHFYTVPSEEVYNKLKEVAKNKYTVDMHPMRPYDKERYANAKVQEAMTIAYSEGTIKSMIAKLNKEIEDYKQLIIDEPEDKAYWEEEIKKCEDEIADLQSYEPLDEDRSSRKVLNEIRTDYHYVTIYERSSTSGPEEGGWTSYGWEAVRSKSFRSRDEALQYQADYIKDAEIIHNDGKGCVHIKDEWMDEILVCVESSKNRGRHNFPALSWSQSEFGYEKPERAYFDRGGGRVLGNPREEAKKRKEQAALDQEFRNSVNAANNREDLIAVLADDRFVKALSNNMDVVTAKLNEISSLQEDKERTVVINEDSELLPIEILNPDGAPKQYDVTLTDPDRVAPKLSWDIADQLEDHFRNNNLWVDELHYNETRNRIEFDINDGDWKHEHLRAKWLIEELFKSLGIRAEISSYTTEENGTDTFSAHYSVYSI